MDDVKLCKQANRLICYMNQFVVAEMIEDPFHSLRKNNNIAIFLVGLAR